MHERTTAVVRTANVDGTGLGGEDETGGYERSNGCDTVHGTMSDLFGRRGWGGRSLSYYSFGYPLDYTVQHFVTLKL